MLRHLFTGSDNRTWDLGRLLWAAVSLGFLGLSFYAVYRGQAFDPMNWGTGAGLVLAGGGGALALKKGTEPEAK